MANEMQTVRNFLVNNKLKVYAKYPKDKKILIDLTVASSLNVMAQLDPRSDDVEFQYQFKQLVKYS